MPFGPVRGLARPVRNWGGGFSRTCRALEVVSASSGLVGTGTECTVRAVGQDHPQTGLGETRAWESVVGGGEYTYV